MTCAFVWQIPRYILTLHELLAHTPHEHVERNSLDYAKSKLEELSRYSTSNCASSTPMHDHVMSTSRHHSSLLAGRKNQLLYIKVKSIISATALAPTVTTVVMFAWPRFKKDYSICLSEKVFAIIFGASLLKRYGMFGMF